MRISIANFKNKLLNGWELLTSDNKAFKVLPTDDVKVTVHTGNKITISTIDALSGCLHSKRVLKEITPVALRHPKNHDRCIAIDQVVVPKQTKPEKTKFKIIVGDRFNTCNIIAAMYIYYKIMKEKGAENVEIVQYDWRWEDGGYEVPFKALVGDTSDTNIIVCGFQSSAIQLTYLDKYTLIPYINQSWHVEKKAKTIVSKLKSLGICPEVSVEDEMDKLVLLGTGGDYIADAPETISGFLNRMLGLFTVEMCAKLLQNTKSKFGVRQAMDLFMESDNKVAAYTKIIDLPLFAKDKDMKEQLGKTGMNVSDYILCNAVSEVKSTHIVIKAGKDVYNEGLYRRVTYPASRAASKLAPKVPIVVYETDNRVTVYSNSEKVTPVGNKVLEAAIEDVMKDKKITHVDIRRCVIV